MVSRTRAKRAGMGILSGAILMGALAGCGSAAQSSGSKTVNLVFATQGLGTEAQATAQAVKEFEKLHPHIHVQIETLSASSNSAYQTLVTDLNSGS
ncbi:MAG TPA: hypothetical protein DD856_12355, partial [Sulfobacillus sp.]|nr:hypothetical protein [Sulfobacillus sp.]